MGSPPIAHEGVDPRWLREAFLRDPVAHSFAQWDIQWEADRVRFLSWGARERPDGYLLVWNGDPARPVVHWVGAPEATAGLVEHLPPRPLTVVGLEGVAPLVEAARGPSTSERLLRMTTRPSGPVPGSDDPRVRRIGPEDAPVVRAWAREHPESLARSYAAFDPSRHVAWGAFDGPRVLGVTNVPVRHPELWTIAGVFVESHARGQRLGSALTAHAAEAARRSGALVHLNVREANGPARRVYERLGFREYDRQAWIDASPVAPNAVRAHPNG